MFPFFFCTCGTESNKLIDSFRRKLAKAYYACTGCFTRVESWKEIGDGKESIRKKMQFLPYGGGTLGLV